MLEARSQIFRSGAPGPRLPRTVLLALLLGLLALPPGAVPGLGAPAPERLPLPVELPLELPAAGEVALEIDNAAVEVRIDAEAPPALSAGLYTEDTPAALAAVREGETLTLRRDPEAGAPERPVWVILTLSPSHRLRVGGTTVRLTLDASGRPPEEGTPPLTLDLRNSEIFLTGVRGAEIAAAGSRLDLSATRGTLELALQDSVAAITDPTGPVKLTGGGDQVEVRRHRGRLDFELEASDLTVADGTEELGGIAHGGSLRLDGWRGRGSLRGRETRIDLAGAPRGGGPVPELRLGGELLTVAVARFDGDLTADLDGGSFDGSALVGKTRITARNQASVVLVELEKSLDLTLAGASTATLRRIDGRAEVRLTGSTLEAEDVRLLGIQAVGSEVTVRRVKRMETVRAADSRVDLSLPAVENDPTLLLEGESTARLLLPAPCAVRLVRRMEETEPHLRVSGCTVINPGLTGPGLREEGSVILKASVEGESLLVVEAGAASAQPGVEPWK